MLPMICFPGLDPRRKRLRGMMWDLTVAGSPQITQGMLTSGRSGQARLAVLRKWSGSEPTVLVSRKPSHQGGDGRSSREASALIVVR